MQKNYRKTLIACCLGFVTQAIAANFAPLLFLTFHKTYGISLGKVALIPTVFFITQLVVDILCAKFVDRIGYRKSIIASAIASAAGLIGLAVLPDRMPDPFIGILICVFVYAIGSGLIEVLCSPMVEACPFEGKERIMSLLHSFYCWGSVGVILLSTLFFAVFGLANWRILVCLWAIIPLFNIWNFATCPIEKLVEEGEGLTIRRLFMLPLFWIAIVLMVCSGASELAMAQWASAFAESALGLSKTMGDLMGPCLFAITMGISRVVYSRIGHKVNLYRYMIICGLLCLVCYVMASMSHSPLVGLIGCILCGYTVGIMWPGTISISSHKIPAGGTAMFALLAMSGDLGGAFGPSLVGFVSQQAQDDLRVGLRVGCIFPILLIVGLVLMLRMGRKKKASSGAKD